jgi:hypothetical protein
MSEKGQKLSSGSVSGKSADPPKTGHSATVTRASTWLRWLFGQPGLPQSFFQSREVFGTPIRAPHVLESGNT